jgi:hypothetical protein
MTENEVKEVQQPEVEDIEVEVTENEAQVETTEASNDDELEKYTKGVSKRINKLNARNRATEERAAKLEAALQQRETEVHAYYQHALQAQQNLLVKEEENVEVKEREANELYKRAHAAGDADLMSKADSLKNEVSIQKEKIRIAKHKLNMCLTNKMRNKTHNKCSKKLSQHKKRLIGNRRINGMGKSQKQHNMLILLM